MKKVVAKKNKPKARAQRSLSTIAPNLLLVLSVVLIVVGVVLMLHQRHENAQAVKRAIASGVAPSTTKPAQLAIDTYSVAPDMPRYLIIPSLGVKARVLAVGLTKAGAIGTPSNVYDTAWYNGSSKPGQPGAALIDGHVSSWTTNGVFYSLNKLKSGDTIQIERGDGTMLNYAVSKTIVYSADSVDMSAVLSPVDPAHPGLNLISCAGDVIKGTNDFNERVVVFASQT